jgi:NADPH-dependent glutamate synthase beta subunit-like oxidoreductase
MDAVAWEVQQMKDLGVKVVHGKALGRDFTVESLKEDGAKAVLVATGLPDPQRLLLFNGTIVPRLLFARPRCSILLSGLAFACFSGPLFCCCRCEGS